MNEVPLSGGRSVDGVVRVGDTVRRPPVWATQTMRDVLVHLEQVGFDAAPRWLGFDDEGRDVLTFVEGETFSDRGEIVWSDDQLAASGRLLRRYHDATAGSPLAGGEEVVSHGDYAPWNLIWRDGLPVCAIDFDNARPGPWTDDLGYAVRAHLNLGRVDLPASEQVRRCRVFTAGYGAEVDIPGLLDHAYDQAEERCLENGWLKEIERLERERAWLAANRAAF